MYCSLCITHGYAAFVFIVAHDAHGVGGSVDEVELVLFGIDPEGVACADQGFGLAFAGEDELRCDARQGNAAGLAVGQAREDVGEGEDLAALPGGGEALV